MRPAASCIPLVARLAIALTLLGAGCSGSTVIGPEQVAQASTPSPAARATAQPTTPTVEPPATPQAAPQATSEPAETAVPLPLPDSSATSFEEAIAGRPYSLPEDVREGTPTWQVATDGMSGVWFEDDDTGGYVDGEYVSEHPDGAFTWTTVIDIDVASRYAYFGVDGAAEPGDRGCFEQLEIDGRSWGRDAFRFAEGKPVFEETPLQESAFDTLPAPGDPGLVPDPGALQDQLGLDPELAELGDGWQRRLFRLDGTVGQQAIADLRVRRSTAGEFDHGWLEVITDPQGVARSLTLWTQLLDEPSVIDDGALAQREETAYLHIRLGPYRADQPRVTPDSPIEASPVCTSTNADIAGRWSFVSLLAGDEIGGRFLGPMEQAYLEISPGGAFVGSTGCRDFEGRSTIAFNQLEDVELAITGGEPCPVGEFGHDEIEALFLDIFFAGTTSSIIDLEDRLFLTTPNEQGGNIVLRWSRS